MDHHIPIDASQISIRPLGIKDLDNVLEVEELSFKYPWSREAYRYEFDENILSRYWGCFYENRLIAFAGYWLIMDEGHIANVAVHPLFRRQGVGELLMYYVMNACLMEGGEKMTLEVRAGNAAGQRLYKKMGFKAAGLRKGYYSDSNEDAVIMWVDLIHLQEEKD